MTSEPLSSCRPHTFVVRLTFFSASVVVHHESVGSRPMIDVGYLGLGPSEHQSFCTARQWIFFFFKMNDSGFKLVRPNFRSSPVLPFLQHQL
jgi:hypothetical protein